MKKEIQDSQRRRKHARPPIPPRVAARLEGKVKNAGVRPVRKTKKKEK